jgi:hypothetical protein
LSYQGGDIGWTEAKKKSNPGIKQNNKRGEEKNDEEILLFLKKGHSNAHHCYGRVTRVSAGRETKNWQGKKTGIRKVRNQRLTASFLIGSIFAVVDLIATLLQCDALAIRFALNLITIV